jgi:hypothetical protein
METFFFCTQYHGNTHWCATNEKYVGLCNTFWTSGNYVAFVRFVFLCMQYHGNTPWCATNEKYVGLCNTFWISSNYVAFVRFVFFMCSLLGWLLSVPLNYGEFHAKFSRGVFNAGLPGSPPWNQKMIDWRKRLL